MTFLTKNPGTVTAFLAVAVLIIGGFAGVSLLFTLLVSFALVVLGATLVNGTYVLRRLLIVIPTIFLVTAFTFYLQNGRGDKRDLAFILLGPGATEAGVDKIVKEFHLDKPMYERYMLWLSDALHGDLGRSAISSQEVADDDRQRHPGLAAADAVRPDRVAADRRAARRVRGVPGEQAR